MGVTAENKFNEKACLVSLCPSEDREVSETRAGSSSYPARVSYMVRATSLYASKSYGTDCSEGQSCLAFPKYIPFFTPACLREGTTYSEYKTWSSHTFSNIAFKDQHRTVEDTHPSIKKTKRFE